MASAEVVGLALLAAHFIEHQIAQDGEHPGGKPCGRFIIPGSLPDADEYLLGDILCLRTVVQHTGHPVAYTEFWCLRTMHFHGGSVAIPDPQHQLGIFVWFRRRHVLCFIHEIPFYKPRIR